jgi:hypothetical protein
LLIAVWMLTNGAPSIRDVSLVTPDSSTIVTVTLTPIRFASAVAAESIAVAQSSEMVGRVAAGSVVING